MVYLWIGWFCGHKGVHGFYVSMSICVICWLRWYVFVYNERISASLAYTWFLSWELELVRLDIAVLDDFFSTANH